MMSDDLALNSSEEKLDASNVMDSEETQELGTSQGNTDSEDKPDHSGDDPVDNGDDPMENDEQAPLDAETEDDDALNNLEETLDLGEEVLEDVDDDLPEESGQVCDDNDNAEMSIEGQQEQPEQEDTTQMEEGEQLGEDGDPKSPVVQSPQSRPLTPTSPHDIEIDYKEEDWRDSSPERSPSPRPRKVVSQQHAGPSVLFGRKILFLQLEKISIPDKADLGKGSVDLKILKKSSPNLFKFEKSGRGRKKSSDENKKQRKNSSETGGKKERKTSTTVKEKAAKKPKESSKNVVKESSNKKQISKAEVSSDSDSDADLKELKARIMKSSLSQNPLEKTVISAKLNSDTEKSKTEVKKKDEDDKPKDDKEHVDKPKDDKKRVEKPKDDKKHVEKPKDDKKHVEKPKEEKRSAERKSVDKKSDEKSSEVSRKYPELPIVLKRCTVPLEKMTERKIEKYQRGEIKLEPLIAEPVKPSQPEQVNTDEKRRSRSSSRRSSLSSRKSSSSLSSRKSSLASSRSSPIRRTSVSSTSSSLSRRSKSRSKSRNKSRSKSRNRSRSKSRSKSRNKSRNRSRSKSRNKSRSKSRDRSRSNSVTPGKSKPKLPKKSQITSDSDSDIESPKEKKSSAPKDASKKLVANPLFALMKKSAASSESKEKKVDPDVDVKKVLVDKLYTLLAPEQSEVETKREKLETAEEETKKGIVDVKIEEKENKKDGEKEKKEDEAKKDTKTDIEEKEKKVEEKKVDREEKPKETFDRVLLENNSSLRQFADTLKIEVGGGTLDFLNPLRAGGSTKYPKIDLAKFEEIVMQAVKSIEKGGQYLSGPVPSKPATKIPPIPERYKPRLGAKVCKIKLKDVSVSSRYKKYFLKAKDNLGAHQKSMIAKRKDRLLSGLRSLKNKNRDSKGGKRGHGSDDSDTDSKHSKKKRQKEQDNNPALGGFKIPKKGEKGGKDDQKNSNRDDLRKEPIRHDKYNHVYKKPSAPVRSFEKDLLGQQVNVFELVSGMNKTLKDDRRKEDFGDVRAKERMQQSNKRPGFNSGRNNQPKHEMDEELERILSMRIQNRKGHVLNAITTWMNGRNTLFKCWICSLELEGKANLMSHLGTYRHLGNKRQFTPVFKDQQPQVQPPQQFQQPPPTPSADSNEWPNPKSRLSLPEPFGSRKLPEPFKRIRPEPDKKVEEPWRFSPSEVEAERYQQRMPSPLPANDDNFDDGFDYPDDAGGCGDYDDDSPPPSPPIILSLPKPVPIILPKPVPITNRNLASSTNNTSNIPTLIGGSTSEPNRVRFNVSPEKSLTPPMPVRSSFKPDSSNPFMRPGNQPLPETGKEFERPVSPKPVESSQPSRLFNPSPPPEPMSQPTTDFQKKQKLSVTELERLPPPMSMRDRVERLRKGPGTPTSSHHSQSEHGDDNIAADDNNDDDNIAAEDDNINNDNNNDDDDDNIAVSPPRSERAAGSPSPIWEPTAEERSVIWPKSQKFDETFNIDTTKSFLDNKASETIAAIVPKPVPPPIVPAPKPTEVKTSKPDKKIESSAPASTSLKLKPVSNLLAPAKQKPGPSSKKAETEPKDPPPPVETKVGFSSFLDKVITALKSSSKVQAEPLKTSSLQLPSLNPDKDDSPQMSKSVEQPQLPSQPPLLRPGRCVSPPKVDLNFETAQLIKDSEVIKIFSELDQGLSEEDKLSNAKEKLTIILRRKAEEKLMQLQKFQQMQQRPSLSDHDINDFMKSYCGGEETMTTTTSSSSSATQPPLPPGNPPPSQPESSEPTLSSALAKLRAKKAARAAAVASEQVPVQPPLPASQPAPLMLALEKLRKIHEPQPPGAPVQPPIPYQPPSEPLSRNPPDDDRYQNLPFRNSEVSNRDPGRRPPMEADYFNRDPVKRPYPDPEPFNREQAKRFRQTAYNDADSQDFYPMQGPLHETFPRMVENFGPSDRYPHGLHNPMMSIDENGHLLDQKYTSNMLHLWNRIHENGSWRKLVDDYQRTAWNNRASASGKQDLGSQFQDVRLNLQFFDSQGNVKPMFKGWEEKGTIHFRCELCEITVFGKKNIDSHIEGRKHLQNAKTVKITDVVSTESGYVPSTALITNLLAKFREAPLIGLEYIVEILNQDQDPIYKCLLCSSKHDVKGIVGDLVSAKHRLTYLKRFFPRAFSKFAEVANLRLWESPTFDFLESVILRIETRGGRLVPTVVKSETEFENDFVKIINSIDNGPHLHQTPDQDFSNLPDVYSSYRGKLAFQDCSGPGGFPFGIK